MRLLHLLDAGSPQATGTTLALLAESLGRLGHAQQRVVLMGPSALGRAAQAAGVRGAQLVGLPCGQILLGLPALRRALRLPTPDDPATGRPFDLIHCWSVRAYSLAAMLWLRTPRLLTLTVAPSPREVQWLRVLTAEAGGTNVLLPISSTIRRALLSGGLPEPAVQVLRPGLTLSRVEGGVRAALRRRWGVKSESTRVVLLLGDPPQAADAVAAMMAVGLAEETYVGGDVPADLRLVLHPDQFRRPSAQRICRQLRRPERIIQEIAVERPWEVLPGCDAALAIAGHDPVTSSEPAQGGVGGGLSLLWAMAGNVPILGEASYAISEIVEDHHSALLTRPAGPKALAHRLRQLLDDPALAYKLRDTARHEAFSFFSRQRYCQSLETVYRQMLEHKPIEVPPLASTGGLRFTGRA